MHRYEENIYRLAANDNHNYYCSRQQSQYSYYFESEVSQLKYEFRRIGSYDFTKKEKKKIENITKPQWSMPVEDLIDKINELVDAVNTLMDKENNV